MANNFKPVKIAEKTIEKLIEVSPNKGDSPNKMINNLLDNLEGDDNMPVTKRLLNAPNCGFICGFKKNCLNFKDRECPMIRRHPDVFDKKVGAARIDFFTVSKKDNYGKMRTRSKKKMEAELPKGVITRDSHKGVVL